MVNYDGVWEVRIFYTSDGNTTLLLPHVHKIDVNMGEAPGVGDSFDMFALTRRDGSLVQGDTWLAEYMALLKPCFGSGAEFSRAELWNIPEGTYNGTFYSVEEIGDPGTNAGTNTPSQQTTFTMRTAGGHSARLQLMESAFSGSARQSPPFASAAANNLTGYAIGTTSPILGRDNEFLIARVHQCDGQNEIVWRKRNRP